MTSTNTTAGDSSEATTNRKLWQPPHFAVLGNTDDTNKDVIYEIDISGAGPS